MSANYDLDIIDLKILDILQQDGAATNQDLSQYVDLSPSQCSRRRAKLEAAGLIEGYRAVLNTQALGYTISAFLTVTLHQQSKINQRKIEALIENSPYVTDAYVITGPGHYMLRVCVPDLGILNDYLMSELSSHESIGSVTCTLVLGDLRTNFGIPFMR